MKFRHQSEVKSELNRALESGDLCRSIQDWRDRMKIAIRQDLIDDGIVLHEAEMRGHIRIELVYEDLIDSLLITIGSLQRRLEESKLKLEGRTERVTLEEGGLT